MEKEVIAVCIKKILLKITCWLLFLLVFFNAFVILMLHMAIPFFPVLFLFNVCFWIGHPLFVKYVLKKKWFECTKDDYLALKYILLPCLIMELMVMLYYPQETYLAIDCLKVGY